MKAFYILVFLLGCLHVVEAATKGVFAHFMVGNTAYFNQSDWESQISLAKEAHIDAFALNMAHSDSTNAPQLVNAFAAANSLGFKLFFSFDYAGNGAWPESEVISLINEYASNSAYYYRDSQPFVSTFEGPTNAEDWISIKQQTGCFFIPDWSSLGAKPALEQANGVADGLFSWAAWPWGSLDINTYVDASYLDYLNETGVAKPYMMPVSPWFYTNLPGYDKNWLWNGNDLWYNRWQEVLFIQPDYVEIISWNDFGESHYIGPLQGTEYTAFEIGKAPFNYVLDMPHDGWRLFLPYVIDTYKNGIATITQEGLVIWYRQQYAAACGDGGTTGNTASQLQIEYSPISVLEDKIMFSALLGSAATVQISIGGVIFAVDWDYTPYGGIGIYHGSFHFNGTGDVAVTIARGGAIIASVSGPAITETDCINGLANWNAWVGYASSSSSISATPELNLADQVCIQGSGANNFAGLCSFSCSYGYCPKGACYCTMMGAQPTLPNATGVQGYPIAGEDPSYSGVCSFDCNYGYCPDTACGTVEVPLSTPTVSPFLPPACTSGEGDGALSGLCSFSCNYGFCPMHACTCLSEGALNTLPAKTNVSGYPLNGIEDYGLCAFACQYGYCPDGTCTTSSSGGTGSLYVSPDIYNQTNPVVSGQPPVNIVFPSFPLSSPLIIGPTSYVSSLEVVTTTSATTTSSGVVQTSTSLVRTIENITVTIPQITVPTVGVYNWNITGTAPGTTVHPLTPSVILPPVTLGPLGGLNRIVTPPPWPWSTGLGPVLPTITFTTGPPGPTCTAGCGQECQSFCYAPCLLNCDGGSGDFTDPRDPDPPSYAPCAGPDCHNGECVGDLCVERGCTGLDCDGHICIGPDCIETGCVGSDCDNGHCNGSNCQSSGCVGPGCNGAGYCFSLSCLSWGCLGLDCDASGTCTGPDCSLSTCSGINCNFGICSGSGCTIETGNTAGNENNDCSEDQGEICTVYIITSTVYPTATLTTETSTDCSTITACSATDSTTTTSIGPSALTAIFYGPHYPPTNNSTALAIIASSLDAQESSWDATATSTTSTTTSSTAAASATPTSYDCSGSVLCGSYAFLSTYCGQAIENLVDTEVYGTTSADADTGDCVSPIGSDGCGVFVQGTDCEFTGDEIRTAANNVYNIGGCSICGNAWFSNGCRVTVNYVSGCTTIQGAMIPAGVNSSGATSGQLFNGTIPNANYSP